MSVKLSYFDLEIDLVRRVAKQLAVYIKDRSSKIKIYPNKRIIKINIPDIRLGEITYLIRFIDNTFYIKLKNKNKIIDKIENFMNVKNIAIDIAYIINSYKDTT